MDPPDEAPQPGPPLHSFRNQGLISQNKVQNKIGENGDP